MNPIDKLKNNLIYIIAIGAVISIVWGGKDSRFWNLTEKPGKTILLEVGNGELNPRDANLSDSQLEEITKLITKNPNEYNEVQKVLISTKLGIDILNEVGNGVVNTDSVILNFKQVVEIKTLINQSPEKYNNAQKKLVQEKSLDEILHEIGMGTLNPKSVKLTAEQQKELELLIESNPNFYNTQQKSLLNN